LSVPVVVNQLSVVSPARPLTMGVRARYSPGMLSREEFHRTYGARPVFGMVHLLPLPGSPLFAGSVKDVIHRAVQDARAIEQGGGAGVLIENFGDRPFRKEGVDPETIATMTAAIVAIRSVTSLPLGVNVLRNDAHAALGIAVATGASFIRVNILVGAMLTDQGLIEGRADQVLRTRHFLGAGAVHLFADHLVKHAVALPGTDPVQLAHDLRERGMADVLISTGSGTGAPPSVERLERLRAATDAPLLIGSGLTAANASDFAASVDGAIAGTSIKEDGDVAAPVSAERLAHLIEAFSQA
jgi:membrane complex biogenesis BtpA family protein